MTYHELQVKKALAEMDKAASKVSVILIMRDGKIQGRITLREQGFGTHIAFTLNSNNGNHTIAQYAIFGAGGTKNENKFIGYLLENNIYSLKKHCGIDFDCIHTVCFGRCWEDIFNRAGFQIIRAL